MSISKTAVIRRILMKRLRCYRRRRRARDAAASLSLLLLRLLLLQ